MLPSILTTTKLFENIEPADLENVLSCVGAETVDVRKDAFLLLAGDKPQHVGVILTGQLHILRENYDGNRLLLNVITPGQIFLESLCYAGVSESPVTAMAAEDSTILLLNFPHVMRCDAKSCPFQVKLLKNMLKLVADYNLQLQSQMEIISLKRIRDRVMRYLESFVPKQGKNITVTLNRENMANFLRVERSALSHELAKMKKDGLIDYKKNFFVIK